MILYIYQNQYANLHFLTNHHLRPFDSLKEALVHHLRPFHSLKEVLVHHLMPFFDSLKGVLVHHLRPFDSLKEAFLGSTPTVVYCLQTLHDSSSSWFVQFGESKITLRNNMKQE